MEDVLQVHSECEDVVEHYLQVCFVGEDGVDGGGQLKDMFSVFWIEAFNTYFTGENVFVPFLSIARQNEDLACRILKFQDLTCRRRGGTLLASMFRWRGRCGWWWPSKRRVFRLLD